jgi:hypothetical protein
MVVVAVAGRLRGADSDGEIWIDRRCQHLQMKNKHVEEKPKLNISFGRFVVGRRIVQVKAGSNLNHTPTSQDEGNTEAT